MKTLKCLLAVIALASVSQSAESPLRLPEEQAAWAAIVARFTESPTVKSDSAKTSELAVTGLRGKAKGEGSASILIDKASGHVVEVTSNGANFRDDDFVHFAAFAELHALTLWHNSDFTGAGLAEAAKIQTMRELRVWHAKFSDAGVAKLRGHPTLESIKLGPSWAPLLTDKTLESLAECPKLTKLGIGETWLTWEGGLRHLVKRKGQLADLDFGNCIIDAAEVERLRREMLGTKVTWGGPNAAAEELKKSWLRARAEQWIPKELVRKALGGAIP
jgi:hypothetical protein